MKRKILSKVVVFTIVASLVGASSVSAAEENQTTTSVQQNQDKDEKIDDSIKEGNDTDIEPSAPGKIEIPETPSNEKKPDEVKPKEPGVKPEEPDKDDKINDSLPDTETDEVDDKDACIGIDGEEEPYEIAENLRATTIPGKWIQAADGRWWYRHENGTYTKNGWECINGQWYYFDGSGWMVTGWIKLNGIWYYLAENGAMATGWYVVNGQWYYFESSGAMHIGWLQLGGKWYYLTSSGAMATGWLKLSTTYYYLNSDGVMQIGWIKSGGEWYYLNSSGAMVTGWQKIDINWYYFINSGEMVTGWKTIPYNGKTEWFYFYTNGKMNDHNMHDTIDGHKRTLYFLSSGVWLYTTSLSTYDLVDGGKHLDWGGKSKYSTYIPKAAAKWNGYKSGIIRKDTVSTECDVTFSDYYEKSDTMGVTSSSGTIRFNKYLMDNANANEKLNVVMHEFGHALGLGHNDKSDVMYKKCNAVVNLTKNDKQSYNAAYKRY